MNRNLNTGITKIKFKNSHIVYENFIKCTVKDYEYNLSFNPTLLSGSQGMLTPYSASNSSSVVYVHSGSNYGILKPFAQGKGAMSYTYTLSSGETLYTGGTNVGIFGDDVVSSQIPIGFDFEFYNGLYNSVYLSTNGVLEFNNPNSAYNNNSNLPDIGFGSALFPFWSDLEVNSSTRADAGIYYQTIGSPGDRIFIADWRVNYLGSTYETNFQIKLYENNNEIEFIYGKIDVDLSYDTTIGIQKDGNDNINYNQYSRNPFTPSIGQKLTYTPTYQDSKFSPYVGAIGLYNDGGDLLAIGKMAAPIPLSSNTDTTFVIKYDTQWSPKPYFTPTPSPTVTPFPTPSITPTISITPTPSTSQIDCGIGTATAAYIPGPTPSLTPTVTVTPTISVTPSITPSNPKVSATPTPTPTPSSQANNITLTFADYDSLSGFTFTLSNPINVPLTVKASVQGYINTGCTRFNGSDIDNTLATIPSYTSTWSSAGVSPLSNNPNVFRYTKNNSMDINGYTVSNGSVITINGVQITIIINTACAKYV
jgi:hypothetical protein